MPRSEPARDLLGRGRQDRQIGLALARERRRQRDEDRVRLSELVVVGRRGEATLGHEPRELLRGNVLDVALPAPQPLDTRGVDVHEDDAAARLDEDLRERHADVAGADDGDVVLHRPGIVATSTSAIRWDARPSP